jgi:hypothetical protein
VTVNRRRALLIPLLLGALAIVAFAVVSLRDTERSEAATDGAAMSLSINGQTGEVDVNVGSQFVVVVSAEAIPANGYTLAQAWIEHTPGLIGKGRSTLWPDCATLDVILGFSPANGCILGIIDPPPSFHKGPLFAWSFNCQDKSTNDVIELISKGQEPAGFSGALFVEHTTNEQLVPSVDSIIVNCVHPPTATPTATRLPFPRMSKNPALSNHWLMRQGAKIPPADCLAGTPTTLTEDLSQAIDSPDTKNPGNFQQLAAFEFEVHYDNKKVCVTLTPGVEFEAAGAVCVIEDSSTKPQLEGVARIGCVTVGKGHEIDELATLAQVDIYPQPELYSQVKPNQENGVVGQLSNVNCDLGDEQGEAIQIFSCDDADITFRYLEGDVEPDCVIDAVDAQAIAFRWGVEKGSLIYKDFMNLEPSGAQADADIDINDLQFVFGRAGSTCDDPHPPQDPVNPKA